MPENHHANTNERRGEFRVSVTTEFYRELLTVNVEAFPFLPKISERGTEFRILYNTYCV